MTTATVAAPTGEFLGINQASRRIKRSAQWIQRLAILQKVRVQLPPGERPRYNLHDLLEIAEATPR